MGQDIGIVSVLGKDYPGRTFAVIPVGYRWDLPHEVFDPEYRKFDRALKTQVRPVLVPSSVRRSGIYGRGVQWPVAELSPSRWLPKCL